MDRWLVDNDHIMMRFVFNYMKILLYTNCQSNKTYVKVWELQKIRVGVVGQ